MVEETRENEKGIKGERKTGGNKYITVEKILRAKWTNCCGLRRRLCARKGETAAACREDVEREIRNCCSL